MSDFELRIDGTELIGWERIYALETTPKLNTYSGIFNANSTQYAELFSMFDPANLEVVRLTVVRISSEAFGF